MTGDMTGDDGSPRSLGDVVGELRARAELTQRQLADLAGLSVAALRDVEQGRVTAPRPASLRRLATALGLTGDDAEELVNLGRRGKSPERNLWIRVLGPLTVTVNGTEVDPGPSRQQLLLGLLALSPNTPVSRDTLIEAGWGEQLPANAVGLVQTSMSRLRHRLAPKQSDGDASTVLAAIRGGYRLSVTREQLDLLEFRHRAAEARREREAGAATRACAAFRKALDLWRGEPLAGLEAPHLRSAVTALVEEWKSLVVDFAETAAEIGRYDDVVPFLWQLVEDDPLHEVANARLMIALAGSGQQAAALALFEKLRRRLRDELGADPGPELTDAHRRVLRQDVVRGETTGADPVTAHRQLPPDILEFTGRQAELAELRAGLPDAARGDTAAGILSIQGMGGVGKTRLAVHLAQQLVAEHRYADIQLYVDLRGHSDEPPAEPATVLASFLRLLGVAGDAMPRGLDERAALFRSQLHDKHAVVLLDNAASPEQVRPLLPASPTNLTLITTRRNLALDGSRTVTLEGFRFADADALLARIVGHRAAEDPQATRAVVELCGRLPLALSLAARRLQARPAWGFAEVAARLRTTADRVGELAAGSRQVSAVFALSYQALEPEEQRMFRLLGLHPGKDFTVESASALVGVTSASGARLLDRLVDEHLVTASPGGRYHLHDLLGDYARHLAEQDGEQVCREAARRVVYWYLHAANAASKPLKKPHDEDAVPEGEEAPAELPAFPDSMAAIEWFRAEQGSLIAVSTVASERGFLDATWQLSAAMRNYFERVSEWDHWISTARMALVAARWAGNRHAEARTLLDLGSALSQIGSFEEAVDLLTRSSELRHELGDVVGQVAALSNRAVAVALSGDIQRSCSELRNTLALIAGTGHAHFEARVLTNLAHALSLAGELDEAVENFRTALERGDWSVDQVGAAQTMDGLGAALLNRGDHDEAIAVLRDACAIYREQRCNGFLIESLQNLETALFETGDHAGAERCQQEAQAIADELGPHRYAASVAITPRPTGDS